MKITKNKFKAKSPYILTDDQWKDIILIGQLNFDLIDSSNLNITQQTTACVEIQEQYFGIDIFESVQYTDSQEFRQYDLKLKLNGLEYLLVKINSIRNKYKIAYYNKNL